MGRRNKNNFVPGFLLGMLAMMIVVAGIFAGVFFSRYSVQKESKNEAKKTTKIDAIVTLISDQYYGKYTTDDLVEGTYKGIVSGLGDPYSAYYTAEEFKKQEQESSGEFYGIGVMASQDAETGIIVFSKVLKDSPAEKSGILANDYLYKVEGKEVTGKNLDDVISRIKGDEGTKVKLTIYRPTTKKYINVTCKRGKVSEQTIRYKVIGKKQKVGYIQITEFDVITSEQFDTAINLLQKKKVKGLIFDVRGNGGGNYNSVCSMLDTLLPECTIVSTKNKNGGGETITSDKKCVKLPMVVLQNQYSASASEIFSSALQDNKKATIVGTKSFGKGIVQKYFPLSDGSAVKLTIEKYYTPSGKNIHGKGINPDVEVEYNGGKTDNQLEKAIKVLSKKIK